MASPASGSRRHPDVHPRIELRDGKGIRRRLSSPNPLLSSSDATDGVLAIRELTVKAIAASLRRTVHAGIDAVAGNRTRQLTRHTLRSKGSPRGDDASTRQRCRVPPSARFAPASGNRQPVRHWIETALVAASLVSKVSTALASLAAWIVPPLPPVSVTWYVVEGVSPVTTCVHGHACPIA